MKVFATSTIIHLDLDAFYASVEQRDRPELQGRPVVVGGSLERGVVSACSYEARTFGVRSAMAMSRALRLCPQAVVLPVRMRRYRELSGQVFSIFGRFTDRVEPLSIDEAFLDVTGCERLFGTGREIAEKIRGAVRREVGLAVSAGIAPNKFLAKLACESAKPDGLLEVRPEEVDAFLLPLPVERLWGVGKVTAEQLKRQGLHRVADLRRSGGERLERLYGSAGSHLWRLAWGEDQRPVQPPAEPKSIGCEETFASDLRTPAERHRELLALCERAAGRLRREGVVGRCLTLKVRYDDFSTITRSQTLGQGTDHAPVILREAEALLARTEAASRPVRLLGVSLSRLEPREAEQPQLFAEEEQARRALDRAVDLLRERFGAEGIARGTLLQRKREEEPD